MRVLVAMSGGVDSSVVACLLKEQGHEVIGVHFELWQDPLAPPCAQVLPTKCCTTQSRARICAVARNLGIPLHVIPLEDAFKCTVVDPFLAAYRMGLTPNPCVLCNRTFKFAHLLSLAKQLNCDRIATGHYARIARRRDQNGQLVFALLEAEDRGKDQSYFLYRLTQRELSRSLFPLGRLLKSQVYTLAKRFSVPLDHRSYRESQDLCFFPEKSPDAFLRRYITNAKPGPIKLLDGTVIGQHKGLPFSTIGQRRGLPISGQRRPLYVVRKEQKSCTIFMAPARAGREKVASVTSLSFTHRPPPEKRSVRFSARIRSRSPKMRGAFVRRGRTGRFTFDRAVSHLTPGQSLVLYRGREIVGGGIVALSSPLRFH